MEHGDKIGDYACNASLIDKCEKHSCGILQSIYSLLPPDNGWTYQKHEGSHCCRSCGKEWTD